MSIRYNVYGLHMNTLSTARLMYGPNAQIVPRFKSACFIQQRNTSLTLNERSCKLSLVSHTSTAVAALRMLMGTVLVDQETPHTHSPVCGRRRTYKVNTVLAIHIEVWSATFYSGNAGHIWH